MQEASQCQRRLARLSQGSGWELAGLGMDPSLGAELDQTRNLSRGTPKLRTPYSTCFHLRTCSGGKIYSKPAGERMTMATRLRDHC